MPGGLGVGWSWGGVFRWFCSISLANGFLEFSISILMGFSKGSRNRDVRVDELSAASGVHFLWFQKFGRAVHRQFRFFSDVQLVFCSVLLSPVGGFISCNFGISEKWIFVNRQETRITPIEN